MLFAVAQLAGRVSGESAPSWRALGQVNFLPDLGFWAWTLWLVSNGWGEELGWRGFALPRLQRTHSALGSSFLLSLAWAGWHLPAFFYVPSYVTLGLWVLPGFLLGILAGAIVLTWLYNSSHGSVLAVVLWHASFNYVSASPRAGGFAAAVTSTLVMLWAAAVVWRYRGATLAPSPKHVTPAGVLAVDDA
jgi:membrane protease YdiL (CAAX protease family)